MTNFMKLLPRLVALLSCFSIQSAFGARIARHGSKHLVARSASNESNGAVFMDASLVRKKTAPDSDHCLPHMTCKASDCCALGTSCNTCPHGHVSDTSKCGWKGLYRCKEWGQKYDVCHAWSQCKAGDCCAWGTSCNTCPHGFVANSNECAGKLEFRCKDWSCTPLNEDPHSPDSYTPCCEGLVKELVDSGDDRRGSFRWHFVCKHPKCSGFAADCPNGYKKKDNLADIECKSGSCYWTDCCEVGTSAPTPSPSDGQDPTTAQTTTSFTPPAGCPWDVFLNTKKDCISSDTEQKLPEVCCERLVGCQDKIEQARNVLEQRIEGYVSACQVTPNDLSSVDGEWSMIDKNKACTPACQGATQLCETLDAVNWQALSAECHDVPEFKGASAMIGVLRAVDAAWTSCPGISHPCSHE